VCKIDEFVSQGADSLCEGADCVKDSGLCV
jgi:hypothetical protein